MAGSRKWFVYTTDEGDNFALELDESNTEAINGGVQDYPDAGSNVKYALPRNVRPRVAIYESVDGRIRKQIVCLTPQIFREVENNVPSFTEQYREQTLVIRGRRGEKMRFPIGRDTYLNDGDAT